MYTEEKPFLLNDYVMLTYFLNNILYKIINDNILGKETLGSLFKIILSKVNFIFLF